jgi:hypothetical protein
MMNVDQVEAMFKACMKSDVTNDADDYPRAVIRSGLRIGSFLYECYFFVHGQFLKNGQKGAIPRFLIKMDILNFACFNIAPEFR